MIQRFRKKPVLVISLALLISAVYVPIAAAADFSKYEIYTNENGSTILLNTITGSAWILVIADGQAYWQIIYFHGEGARLFFGEMPAIESLAQETKSPTDQK